MEFEPEPKYPVRCLSEGCGKSIIGYQCNGYSSAFLYCGNCAENEWNKGRSEHSRLMAADRAVIGDEAFVKLALDDATLQHSTNPGQGYYILSFKNSITSVVGSSGYAPTPEACWAQMADKVDRYLRAPYR